jgi:hypothetical protein
MRAISAALVVIAGSIMTASSLASATAKGDNPGSVGVGVIGLGIAAIGLITWFVMLFIGDKSHV